MGTLFGDFFWAFVGSEVLFAMSVWIKAMGASKERKGRGKLLEKTKFSTPYKRKGRIFVRTRGWAQKT